MLAFDRLALVKSTAVTTDPAFATRRLIVRTPVCHVGFLAAAATTAAARTIKIQAFETECSATAAATTCCPTDNQQTLRLLPWPYEDTGFNNSAKPYLLHSSISSYANGPTGSYQFLSRQLLLASYAPKAPTLPTDCTVDP